MGWLKDNIDDGKNIGRYSNVPAYFNLIGFGNYHDKERGNDKMWENNCRENLKWLAKNPEHVLGSVTTMPEHEDQAIIFVGMSPNIKKSWKYLKNLDKRFVIVATNSSAKYLLDRGIKPHYVIALDGAPGSWTLKLGKKAKDIVGLFSTTVEPQALKDWPGKILVIPYGTGPLSLRRKVEERFGKPFPGGGNAINGAVIAFLYNTKAKIFMFVGNELSFKDKYYADRECKHDKEGKFYAIDVNGKRVKTLFPLWEYKVWLENLASTVTGDCWFCNCSEGILGVEVDGTLLPFIGQMSLPDAIKEVQKAWDYENLPFEERARIMYDEAYDSGHYHPINGPMIWESLRDQGIKFTKGLDVGCGTGQGIKEMRDAGYDLWGADIADNRKIWEGFGISDYCITAPAHRLPYNDNEFDLVLCSDVMEHIPEDLIEDSFKEMLRVGSKEFVFTICLQKENQPLMGFIHTHVTVKDYEWWLDKISKSGFKSIKYDDRNQSSYSHVTVKAYKCQQ
jgi:2-polyprenyl-3-methyl-5-hydroxy-6-metoxy-1,4-benzoquinol methylase